MARTSVYVEFDLAEVDDDDLVKEVMERFKNGGIGNRSFKNVIFAENLNDELKIEYLQEVWDRLSPSQLENGLNAIIQILGK